MCRNNFKHFSYVLAICLVVFLSACSTPPDKVFKQNAQVITEQILDKMAAKNYIEILPFYNRRFFERLTPEQWLDSLEKLDKVLGKYQSRKMTASSVTHGYSTRSLATTVLVYRVIYEKKHAIQKFTFSSDESANNMTLVGHYIDFPEDSTAK